jgi:hypothetical protein
MKKRKMSYIVLLCLGSILMSSCLDEHPKDQLDEDKAYTNATNLYVNTVATLYNYLGGTSDSQGLQGTYRGVYDFNTFTTDEAILPTRGADWYDGGFWRRLYYHTWTPSDESLKNTWNYLYKVVILCNRSLQLLDKHAQLLTRDQLVTYQAEVRAIRAMFYFYLMDMFGRIPLVTSYDMPLKDVKQSSRSDAFHFIFDELQDAAGKLSHAHSNLEGDYYGRMTAPVAYFLLAKLSLNAEIYTDNDWTDNTRPDGKDILLSVDGAQKNAWETCIYYCEKLKEEGYRLESDYSFNFQVLNETSAENIFTIPMDKTLYTNIFKNLFRSRHYNHGAAIGMDAENGTCATLSTVRTYGYGTDSIDHRYRFNFFSDTLYVDGRIVRLDNGDPLVYKPLAVSSFDLTGTPDVKTAGARMSKYEIDRSSYSDGQLQGNDIVLFRYADVLLMEAEAKVRNGGDGNAELNAVRSRVGMGFRKATLSNILEERLLELMWEGWRRNDMIRFGSFTDAYDLRTSPDKDGHTIVFPIPQDVLDLNVNLSQNKNYE